MTTREELNKTISELDDEGFSWLARALMKSAMLHGALTQVWPDGLGGFRDREKIEHVRALATKYIEEFNG